MSSLEEVPPTQDNEYINNVISTIDFIAKISQLLYSNLLWQLLLYNKAPTIANGLKQ